MFNFEAETAEMFVDLHCPSGKSFDECFVVVDARWCRSRVAAMRTLSC